MMIDYGSCVSDALPDHIAGNIDTLRVCFHKKDVENAMRLSKTLKNKGYKVFIQPMVTASYSEDELVSLITKANEMSADAFYLVDSHGTMNKDELLKLFNIADKNLAPDIAIGFHSHNNLQLAFSNALTLLDVDTEREIIIDSSVFGMGRGAGNLCTELLMQELNTRYGEKYDLEPIFKIYDEHLKDIYEKASWGYSMPLFISAKHKCHPNYAIHLDKLGLSSSEIDKILSNISSKKKSVFNKGYMQKLYDEYINQKRQYDCIAFDLDGTLIDSAEGVLNAIRYVEKELQLTPLDEQRLKLCIGPPLKYTYGVVHQLSGETLEKAVSLHKEYMSEKGYKEAKLYDGVEEMLKSLKARGKKLAVATLKQESIAKQTLSHLGIGHYFDLILGQNPTESLKKANLLTQIKKELLPQRLVLVGDSKFDEEAANATNTDFIAVTYGYGFAPDINTDAVKAIKLCRNTSGVKVCFN